MGKAVARPQTNPALEMKQAQQAYELILAGKSYRQAAQEMGVSLGTVQRRLEKYKAETVEVRAAELREVQHARIQAGIAANWKGYIAGDKDATTSVLRLMEREARLMGLDSAQAFTVQAQVVDHTTEANRILERMLAMKAAGRTITGEVLREVQ
ncbi:sigma factor-like helix-turn-helix DNA-binding protein [Streptomyces sp. NPDC127051]|uniref:sigma factor-like helix-turn-helix DNA-binding protein n=1 Tax=Streptomyces sp. NPDC127051 TaxID=3347119 RepID=UPI003667644F